jgi:hypothetical protein
MPLYASIHTDYTSAERPKDVDKPAEIYVIDALDARKAAQEIDEYEDNPIGSTESEGVFINLDLFFDYLRKHGYQVAVPRMSEIKPRA